MVCEENSSILQFDTVERLGSPNASIRRGLTRGRFDSVHFNVTKFSSRCILTRGWWFREPSFSPLSRRSPYSHLLVFENRSDFTRFHRVSLSRPEHPFPFNRPQPMATVADSNVCRSNLPDRINATVGCQNPHKPSPSPSPRVTSLRLFTLRLLDEYLRDRSRILQQRDRNGNIRSGGTMRRYDGANDFTTG